MSASCQYRIQSQHRSCSAVQTATKLTLQVCEQPGSCYHAHCCTPAAVSQRRCDAVPITGLTAQNYICLVSRLLTKPTHTLTNHSPLAKPLLAIGVPCRSRDGQSQEILLISRMQSQCQQRKDMHVAPNNTGLHKSTAHRHHHQKLVPSQLLVSHYIHSTQTRYTIPACSAHSTGRRQYVIPAELLHHCCQESH